MMPVSGFLWKTIPFLSFAQFPWRFLMCTAFAVSFLAGGCVIVFDKAHRLKVLLAGMVVVVAASISYCHPFGYQDIAYRSSKDYLKVSTPLDNMEYLPRGVRQLTLTPVSQKLQPWAGTAEVLFKSGTGLDERYQVRAQTSVVMGYHGYYFPGWEVAVDGRKVDISAANVFGLIMFTVPPGDHDVRLHFGTTPLRRAAETVSMITAFILTGIFCFYSGIGRFLLIFRKRRGRSD
jgi:hypothetical protein